MANAEWMLTPEEIRAIPFYKNTPDEALPYELIKAEAKKMVKWIEGKFGKVTGNLVKPYRFINEEDWQALVKKRPDTGGTTMKERPIIFTENIPAILEGGKTQTRRVIKPQPVTSDGMIAKAVPIWLYPSEFVQYCPYGQVSDRLWVREAYYAFDKTAIIYKAEMGDIQTDTKLWKPSIFMPRWASRITLEITEVRVERLQEISYRDSKSEGCISISDYAILWDSLNAKRDYGWETNPWVWVISFKRIEDELAN